MKKYESTVHVVRKLCVACTLRTVQYIVQSTVRVLCLSLYEYPSSSFSIHRAIVLIVKNTQNEQDTLVEGAREQSQVFFYTVTNTNCIISLHEQSSDTQREYQLPADL